MTAAELWLAFYFCLSLFALVWSAARIGKRRQPYTHTEWVIGCLFFAALWLSVWTVAK